MTQHPDLFAALARPFDPSEVKTRSQAGHTLSYVTARTVMNRLDDVLGPENWWDEFVPTEHSVICRLTIRLPDGSTLTKSDAGGFAGMADPGDDDKSGFTDAIKRAAVKFGVGRYLYRDGTPKFVQAATDCQPPTSNGAAPDRPVAAQRQDQPFDPTRLPRAGSGALYYWLKDLGKLYQTDVYAKVLEICKLATPPMTTDFKTWTEEAVADMVKRVIRYCKRLPNYRDEFGPAEPAATPAAQPTPGADLTGGRSACHIKATLLFASHYPGKPHTNDDLRDIIKAYSGEKIEDLFQCQDVELIRKTRLAIEAAIEDAKKLRTSS